jgi:hypothetical protein
MKSFSGSPWHEPHITHLFYLFEIFALSSKVVRVEYYNYRRSGSKICGRFYVLFQLIQHIGQLCRGSGCSDRNKESLTCSEKNSALKREREREHIICVHVYQVCTYCRKRNEPRYLLVLKTKKKSGY